MCPSPTSGSVSGTRPVLRPRATVDGVRTRLLATTALLLAVASGCGDESVPTTDPGHAPPTSPSPSESSESSESSEPTDVGAAFVAFARGGPLPPVADELELYLGNALTGVLAARQAGDRRAWATCTELGTYAGATCPLSPLTLLRGREPVDQVAEPRTDCLATYGPLPPDLRGLDRTVLVPPHDAIDDCAESFAIQLVTDDQGELVAVSTLLGER